MWQYGARGLCGWRCIPIIVTCVCFREREYIKVQVQLWLFVCLWSVCQGLTHYTDRRVRPVDARVSRPWEIYGSVNSGWRRAAPCLSQISACVRQRCAPPLVNMWVFPFGAPEVCVLVFPYCSWHLQSLWNAAILWCHCSGSCKTGKWLAFSRPNIQSSVQYIESFQTWISNRYTIHNRDSIIPKECQQEPGKPIHS